MSVTTWFEALGWHMHYFIFSLFGV